MKELEPPRFLPNDLVFAIPNDLGWHAIGEYIVSKVEIVPKDFAYNPKSGRHEPSEEKRYVYYGRGSAWAIELKHVFKDKQEFLAFANDYEFPFLSPRGQ